MEDVQLDGGTHVNFWLIGEMGIYIDKRHLSVLSIF